MTDLARQLGDTPYNSRQHEEPKVEKSISAQSSLNLLDIDGQEIEEIINHNIDKIMKANDDEVESEILVKENDQNDQAEIEYWMEMNQDKHEWEIEEQSTPDVKEDKDQLSALKTTIWRLKWKHDSVSNLKIAPLQLA